MSNTPESDEAWDSVSRDRGGLHSSITPMKNYAKAMLEKSKELECERDELLEWKRQAMAVMPDYQEIGRLLNLPVGSAVNEHIVPAIQQRNELRDAIRQAVERFDKVRWGWDGCCGSSRIMSDLEDTLDQTNTTTP